MHKKIFNHFNSKVLMELVANGFDLNSPVDSGLNLLAMSIEDTNQALFDALIEVNLDLDQNYTIGVEKTPLEHLIDSALTKENSLLSLSNVKTLVENGAVVSRAYLEWSSLVELAVALPNMFPEKKEIVEYLLNNSKDYKGADLLKAALNVKDYILFEFLYEEKKVGRVKDLTDVKEFYNLFFKDETLIGMDKKIAKKIFQNEPELLTEDSHERNAIAYFATTNARMFKYILELFNDEYDLSSKKILGGTVFHRLVKTCSDTLIVTEILDKYDVDLKLQNEKMESIRDIIVQRKSIGLLNWLRKKEEG